MVLFTVTSLVNVHFSGDVIHCKHHCLPSLYIFNMCEGLKVDIHAVVIMITQIRTYVTGMMELQ